MKKLVLSATIGASLCLSAIQALAQDSANETASTGGELVVNEKAFTKGLNAVVNRDLKDKSKGQISGNNSENNSNNSTPAANNTNNANKPAAEAKSISTIKPISVPHHVHKKSQSAAAPAVKVIGGKAFVHAITEMSNPQDAQYLLNQTTLSEMKSAAATGRYAGQLEQLGVLVNGVLGISVSSQMSHRDVDAKDIKNILESGMCEANSADLQSLTGECLLVSKSKNARVIFVLPRSNGGLAIMTAPYIRTDKLFVAAKATALSAGGSSMLLTSRSLSQRSAGAKVTAIMIGSPTQMQIQNDSAESQANNRVILEQAVRQCIQDGSMTPSLGRQILDGTVKVVVTLVRGGGMVIEYTLETGIVGRIDVGLTGAAREIVQIKNIIDDSLSFRISRIAKVPGETLGIAGIAICTGWDAVFTLFKDPRAECMNSLPGDVSRFLDRMWDAFENLF